MPAIPIRLRKLIGMVLLLAFIVLYALVMMVIGGTKVHDASKLGQGLFYAFAGLAWVIPAGVLIKWMQRPDPE